MKAVHLRFFVPFIEHGLYAAKILAGNHQVAIVQGSALNQDGSHIAPAFIQGGFDDASGGFPVGIGFQVEQFRFQHDLFQQQVNVQSFFGGYLLGLEFATPVFHQDIHAGQLFLYLFGIGAVLINFIDGKYHGQAGGLGMGDGFFCLRHHCIIGGDHDHCDIGGLGAAGTHGRKCFVTGRIEEGDLFAVCGRHLVGADMLGDPAGFTGHHIGAADIVQQGGLTMVDVTHDRDDGDGAADLPDHLLLHLPPFPRHRRCR